MNIFGFDISRKARTVTIDQLIANLELLAETVSGVKVDGESCMESPTVHAIVTAVSRHLAVMPVHVLRQRVQGDRVVKERMRDHPAARLMAQPNEWQTRVNYWMDAASWLVRYGNHYAFKARGATGPVRRLESWPAGRVDVEQRDNFSLTYKVHTEAGVVEYSASDVHHVRGPARNGYKGNSPVIDARESIALEIAAERFGGTFFGNGAMPALVFGVEGTHVFRSDEARREFVRKFQEQYGRRNRFGAMLLPKGIKVQESIKPDNENAQFLQTRQYQRTVIAGAFGVPPHLVGDLQRGTFNNVEQQSIEFIQGVMLPYVRMFEAAMERDLLTETDRRSGIVIRFNVDGALRGDFKTRQEGLKIMREAGVINPNDWREMENMNPIPEEQGGEEFWRQGPSGQAASPPNDPSTQE